MMNPPKLEICFEGYNTDQTDFYIGQLIEKINILESSNESANERLSFLEAENKQLRSELLTLIKQCRNAEFAESDQIEVVNEMESDCVDAAFNESKNEVNSAIKENLATLRAELCMVKDFIKNN